MKRIVSFLLVLLLTLTLCVTAFAAPVGRKAVCSGPTALKCKYLSLRPPQKRRKNG